ncbi:unnamed protein product [Laminaria digitata]
MTEDRFGRPLKRGTARQQQHHHSSTTAVSAQHRHRQHQQQHHSSPRSPRHWKEERGATITCSVHYPYTTAAFFFCNLHPSVSEQEARSIRMWNDVSCFLGCLGFSGMIHTPRYVRRSLLCTVPGLRYIRVPGVCS